MVSSNSWTDESNSAPLQPSGRLSTMPLSGRISPMSTSSTLKSSKRTPPSLREKTPVSTPSTSKSSKRKPPSFSDKTPMSTPSMLKSSSKRSLSIEPSVYEKVSEWLKTVRIENGSQKFEDCDDCLSLYENGCNGRRYCSERGYVYVGTRERGGRDDDEDSVTELSVSVDRYKSPEEVIKMNMETKNIKKKKRMKKKKKKKKKKCNAFTRLKNTGETVVDLNTTEGLIRLANVIHPKVVCGHKNCLTTDIVTPKGMGWLWNVQKIDGRQVSRNWKPGAIPKNVATVMEKGKTGYYKKKAEDILARKVNFDYLMQTRRKKIFEKHLGYAPSSHKLITKTMNPRMTNTNVVSSSSNSNYSESIVSNWDGDVESKLSNTNEFDNVHKNKYF